MDYKNLDNLLRMAPPNPKAQSNYHYHYFFFKKEYDYIVTLNIYILSFNNFLK